MSLVIAQSRMIIQSAERKVPDMILNMIPEYAGDKFIFHLP